MSEITARLEEEQEESNSMLTENSVVAEKDIVQNEIECPRCNGMMALCSDFDSLFYNCEECDFILYTIKKGTVVEVNL